MAAKPAASFADILAAESDYVMPTNDLGVQAALVSFGAVFKKLRNDANVAARADLLAGLALLHTHHHDLTPLVAVLTTAQHQTLATALGLDFQAHGTDASWQVLLARSIVSLQAPGQTPKKRKPVRDGSIDGQIRRPGEGGAQSDSADASKGQQSSKKKKTLKKSKPVSSSDRDSSAATSPSSEADASSPGPTVVELMPDALGSGPAFDSLVAAVCARKWLSTSTLEEAIPATYLPRLFRACMWPEKQRAAYDKMIRKQPSQRPALHCREDPTRVAFPHRLKFSFSPDDGPELDAEHLRLVCAGERLSDWSSTAGRALGGTFARSEYQHPLDELSDIWARVSGAIQRGERIGAPSSKPLTDTILNIFERRYTRFARVLPAGRARAWRGDPGQQWPNLARQLGELRAYFDTSLADSASRVEYHKQARWVSFRVNTLSPRRSRSSSPRTAMTSRPVRLRRPAGLAASPVRLRPPRQRASRPRAF